jgi:hypothetical protein
MSSARPLRHCETAPTVSYSSMDARVKDTSGAMTAAQSRAARGLLGWTLDQLIAASGMSKRTLIRFEASRGTPRASTVLAVRATLEAAGVEFIDENGGGPGVRLRKAADR